MPPEHFNFVKRAENEVVDTFSRPSLKCKPPFVQNNGESQKNKVK